jgi:DNA-binding NtrC family response regulator
MTTRVLVVDDERSMVDLIRDGLGRRDCTVTCAGSAQEALELLPHADVDVVVTDLRMGGMSGLDLCERIAGSRPDLPVIVVTAFGSLDAAVGSIRAGAYDFLTKPFDIEVLAIAVRRAAQHRALRDEVRRLRKAVDSTRSLGDMVGASGPMQELFGLLTRAAAAESSVLITGESGTGKEMVARELHARSRRTGGPFVAVNCAALPEALLESELFGHARGAFTDARQARTGLFLQAAGGTLLLDEIGDMPLGLQPKLLRALQARSVRPVGSDQEHPFNARIIAATNRDLDEHVEQGRFREDLYYRLNVIHVPVPPLRARGGDVLLLAQSFLERFAAQMDKSVAGLSPPAAEKLLAYSWPGNVRELSNCIERAVALTQFDHLVVDDLPERVRSYRRSDVLVAGNDPSELAPLEQVERRYVLRVLEAAGGNKTLAAQILGLDRRTLYRKLERWAVGTEDPTGS